MVVVGTDRSTPFDSSSGTSGASESVRHSTSGSRRRDRCAYLSLGSDVPFALRTGRAVLSVVLAVVLVGLAGVAE